MIVTAPDGLVAGANARAEQLLNLSERAMRGQPLAAAIPTAVPIVREEASAASMFVVCCWCRTVCTARAANGARIATTPASSSSKAAVSRE